MHFRQRIAWLLVLFYLASTCGIVYYIFEITDSFNAYALDHVERYHAGGDSESQSSSSLFGHITDIPLAVWLLILLLPYLQVFGMLMACTKPEPRLSMAFLWPFVLFIRCRMVYEKLTGQVRVPKAVNTPLQNGHIVIDT